MKAPTKIEEIYNQPTYHFWHLGQEYFIYLNVASDEEGKEPRMIALATPERQGGIFIPKEVLRSQAWEIAKAATVREGIETMFLPKVNEYLASLGGDVDNSFPITGSDLEQYNWIVENALVYVNGKIAMSF